MVISPGRTQQFTYWRRKRDGAPHHVKVELMKVLSRWATLGFAVLAFVLGVVIAAVAMWTMMPAEIPARVDGTTFAVVSLLSTTVWGVTLTLASRRSGANVLAYLALDIPRRRHIEIAMAGLAILIILFFTLTLVLGRDTVPPSTLEIYRSAQADGSLIWLWLAIVVAAPIGEELLFRGFMFRGFVYTPRDAIPSIVLISLIWSLTHIDYDWFVIAEIFVFGVLYGFVRWRTGSTTLTILLHMVNNLVALGEAGFMLS
jgi:membrane protease YdiL (CAAX protease family)